MPGLWGGVRASRLHGRVCGGLFTAVLQGLMPLLNNVKNLLSFDSSDVPNLPRLRLIKQLQYSQLSRFKNALSIPIGEQLT